MAKLIDLTGRVFGKLTVTGGMERKSGKVYWWCKCQCGVQKQVASCNLLGGKSLSCGCSWGRVEGLEGRRFGKLVVQGKSSDKSGYWDCLCDCGNRGSFQTYSLTTNRTVSCGCWRKRVKNDLEGQKFGRLTVTGKATRERRGKHPVVAWPCTCECGTTKLVFAPDLKSGVSSCGCLQVERSREVNSLPDGVAAFNYTVEKYKREAGYRGLDWALTNEEAVALLGSVCHYCGDTPRDMVGIHNFRSGKVLGIDRKDSSLGYEPGNVVSCCKICNRAKSDMPYADFIKYISRIIVKNLPIEVQ